MHSTKPGFRVERTAEVTGRNVDVEGPLILRARLSVVKRSVMDRLPGVGVDLFQDVIRVAALQVREEGRKSDCDRDPRTVFFVKSVPGSQERM